jgi:glycosyltransferase involved in cell wall biosynthesis
MPELTILMPCLNEAETIGKCIEKARRSIVLYNLDAEILIADNGSSDNSVVIAKSLGARVVHTNEKGYGNTLRFGIREARGKYIVMADSDDSYDFSDFYPFVVKLREGFDLVVGNRFKGGIATDAMPFLHRYLGNPVLTFIGRLFFGVKLSDFHCGYRGFSRQAMLDSNLVTTGMEFASEMIVKSSLKNQRISEVPVKLYPDGRSRAPHLRTWRDGWRHLRFLLLYSPRWLFFYPGLLLIIFGVILNGVLLPGPLMIRTVQLDIHALLYGAIAIVMGFQAVSFYCCAKVLKIDRGLDLNRNWLQAFLQYFTLERGIAVGGCLLVPGILLALYSFMLWRKESFGDMRPNVMMRIIIPSITLLMLGTQVIFNSFFMGILTLETRGKK